MLIGGLKEEDGFEVEDRSTLLTREAHAKVRMYDFPRSQELHSCLTVEDQYVIIDPRPVYPNAG